MKPHPKPAATSVSEWIERTQNEDVRYRFYEASGMGLDAGLTVDEADRAAYKNLFGIDWNQP